MTDMFVGVPTKDELADMSRRRGCDVEIRVDGYSYTVRANGGRTEAEPIGGAAGFHTGGEVKFCGATRVVTLSIEEYGRQGSAAELEELLVARGL